MDFDKSLSKNLILHDSQTIATYSDTGEIAKVRFNFSFYDTEYVAEIRKDAVDDDFPSIEAEGDSELFDSFVEQIEDTHWEYMKTAFALHLQEENELSQ